MQVAVPQFAGTAVGTDVFLGLSHSNFCFNPCTCLLWDIFMVWSLNSPTMCLESWWLSERNESALTKMIQLNKTDSAKSFSRNITKRYLLKPTIPIITYFHSMLRRTDSKRPEVVPRIITQFAWFSSWIFDKTYLSPSIFDIVLVCSESTSDQGSFRRCASKSSLQAWCQSILLSKHHQKVF